ncbi:MAG: hypothetical protein PHI35_08615, partial [Victivallaceae bacterium]|nr:hypothetical protein [Victivallaceae bacterium]
MKFLTAMLLAAAAIAAAGEPFDFRAALQESSNTAEWYNKFEQAYDRCSDADAPDFFPARRGFSGGGVPFDSHDFIIASAVRRMAAIYADRHPGTTSFKAMLIQELLSRDGGKRESAYGKALAKNPDSLPLLRAAAEFDLKHAFWSRATAEYEKLTRLEPRNAINFIRLYGLYMLAERNAEAAAILTRLTQTDLSEAELLELACELLSHEHPREALTFLAKAKSSPAADMLRAIAEQAQGNRPEAARQAASALISLLKTSDDAKKYAIPFDMSCANLSIHYRGINRQTARRAGNAITPNDISSPIYIASRAMQMLCELAEDDALSRRIAEQLKSGGFRYAEFCFGDGSRPFDFDRGIKFAEADPEAMLPILTAVANMHSRNNTPVDQVNREFESLYAIWSKKPIVFFPLGYSLFELTLRVGTEEQCATVLDRGLAATEADPQAATTFSTIGYDRNTPKNMSFATRRLAEALPRCKEKIAPDALSLLYQINLNMALSCGDFKLAMQRVADITQEKEDSFAAFKTAMQNHGQSVQIKLPVELTQTASYFDG